MPAAAAAAATAGSPAECIIRVKPVGDRARGIEAGLPRMVVVVSTFDTSRRTRGTNSMCPKASRERWSEISASAAPST